MKKYLLILVIAIFALGSRSQAQTSDSSWYKEADTAVYKGKYKVEGMPFEYVEITVKEARLYFSAGGYEGYLDPIKDKKESFDALGQAVFTFTRNADGTDVEAMKIDYSGMVIDGKKEKK
jgi:cytochrome c